MKISTRSICRWLSVGQLKWGWTVVALSLLVSQAGCALAQLPFALLGAAIGIAQIPLQLVLSLIGPATKLAPAALLFVQRNPTARPDTLLALTGPPSESREILQGEDLRQAPHEAILGQEVWDLVVLQGEGLTEKIHPHAQGSRVLAAYLLESPVSSSSLEDWLRGRDVRAYLARI